MYRLCSASCEPRRCRGGTMKSLDVVTFTAAIVIFSCFAVGQVGKTQMTKWEDGKNGALSLTCDDGSINQSRVAVPIMDSFGFPATFFIITGNIASSQYHCTVRRLAPHESDRG